MSKTILIIEDDKFLSSMYADKFSLDGFHVVTAFDGEEGVSMARQSQPDLILLDLILPKLDGFSVLKHLRSSKECVKTPVLVLSNISEPGQLERGKALGATDFLIKAHFVPSEVLARVKQLLAV